MSHLDEVVRFIEKNSARISLVDVFWVLPNVPTFMKAHYDTSQAVGTCQAQMPAVTLSLGRRDTSPLRIPRSRCTLEEAIHPLGRLGTNCHSIKAVTRIHSRGQIGINLPLHLDSRPRPLALLRPALLHQPRGRVMSSLM